MSGRGASKARVAVRIVDAAWPRALPTARAVAEQAAILGAFNAELLGADDQAMEVARFIARRRDGLLPEAERGGQADLIDGGGFAFSRTLRGVTERHVGDGARVRSAEARPA